MFCFQLPIIPIILKLQKMITSFFYHTLYAHRLVDNGRNQHGDWDHKLQKKNVKRSKKIIYFFEHFFFK